VSTSGFQSAAEPGAVVQLELHREAGFHPSKSSSRPPATTASGSGRGTRPLRGAGEIPDVRPAGEEPDFRLQEGRGLEDRFGPADPGNRLSFQPVADPDSLKYAVVSSPPTGRSLKAKPLTMEILRPVSAASATVALFDFDGTISLVRSGWMGVMVPMMVEVLAECRSGETEAQLRVVVEDFVWRLTGQETIYQMIRLAEEVRLRGGSPLDPLVYKKSYLDGLWQVIRHRVEELRDGRCAPEKYMVPGARAWLEALARRGLRLYLASGTDEIYLQEEARLLDVTRYFDGGVYGALDDYRSFSKRMLVERILTLPETRGANLLGFGDGYVEIEEVKRVGGVAVGVASDEPACLQIDEWKRQRLIGAGADYIVPNYLALDSLGQTLFSKS
jgi:phosphoglycolate phosphatase